MTTIGYVHQGIIGNIVEMLKITIHNWHLLLYYMAQNFDGGKY